MAIVQYKNFAYLKGPKGDKGDRGPQGDRGPRGDTGPAGARGPVGPAPEISEVRSYISGSGEIVYDTNTGVISFDPAGYATEAYVDSAINSLIDNAPGTLDTLNELAAALGDDANFASTVINSLNGKLSLSGGTLTGNLTLANAPTATLHAATKGYVDVAVANAIAGYEAYDQSLNTTDDVEFNTVKTKSIEFSGTGPVAINSGNDLNFTAAGDITFNGVKLSDIPVDGGSF